MSVVVVDANNNNPLMLLDRNRGLKLWDGPTVRSPPVTVKPQSVDLFSFEAKKMNYLINEPA